MVLLVVVVVAVGLVVVVDVASARVVFACVVERPFVVVVVVALAAFVRRLTVAVGLPAASFVPLVVVESFVPHKFAETVGSECHERRRRRKMLRERMKLLTVDRSVIPSDCLFGKSLHLVVVVGVVLDVVVADQILNRGPYQIPSAYHPHCCCGHRPEGFGLAGFLSLPRVLGYLSLRFSPYMRFFGVLFSRCVEP